MQGNSKKVVIVITNDNTVLHGNPTGWYVPEVGHPWDVFIMANVEMVFASINGGLCKPDAGSFNK